MSTPRPAWRNRITGHGEESPDRLLANPKNFRRHPRSQREAMAGVLGEVGLVDEVIVNRQTGFLLNGHLRVSLALEQGQATVPVKYVDLTPEEEALVLATFDPLTAMAEADRDALEALMAEVKTESPAVLAMLEGLAQAELSTFAAEESEAPNLSSDDRPPFRQMTFTLHDEQAAVVAEALSKAKRDGLSAGDVNENSNGNALAGICGAFLRG